MVCLNKKLPINILQMKKELFSTLNDIIDDNMDFIDDAKKEKIKNNIINDFKNEINKDFFLYKIIDEDYCTFKHKRGKNDGIYCCKKIKTNLDINQKKDYLCCTHSKLHIPKKREIKNMKNMKNKTNLTNLPDSKDIKIPNDTITKNIYKNNKVNKIYLYSKKNKNKFNNMKTNMKTNAKVYSNFNIPTLNKVKENNNIKIIGPSFSPTNNISDNIIKYKNSDFKHINNIFSLFDNINS